MMKTSGITYKTIHLQERNSCSMSVFNLSRKTGQITNKRKKHSKGFRGRNLELILLASPILIYYIIYKYIPMIGLIIAFKNVKYNLGFLRSPWVGLENFQILVQSDAFFQITRNTILYNLAFIVINNVAAILVALLLNEIKSKTALKVYQTSMFIPYFLSYIIVGYIMFTFLNPTLGILNRLLPTFGLEMVDWYQKAKAWIVILPLVNLWKGLGYGTIMFYTVLIGINKEYYEAAAIDGATAAQKAWYVSIPFLKPTVVVLVLISLGNVFRGDFGLFYMVPMQASSPFIYSTTDVIDTYVYRALKMNSDLGMSSAAGLYQSVMGFVTIMICNKIAKRVNDGNGLF